MNYYDEIKKELLNNEVTKKAKDYSKNKGDLTAYYNVGKLLKEASKHYGEEIIRYFRKFYEILIKHPTVSDKLSYSHLCTF